MGNLWAHMYAIRVNTIKQLPIVQWKTIQHHTCTLHTHAHSQSYTHRTQHAYMYNCLIHASEEH